MAGAKGALLIVFSTTNLLFSDISHYTHQYSLSVMLLLMSFPINVKKVMNGPFLQSQLVLSLKTKDLWI